jgi:hypothetical protein
MSDLLVDDALRIADGDTDTDPRVAANTLAFEVRRLRAENARLDATRAFYEKEIDARRLVQASDYESLIARVRELEEGLGEALDGWETADEWEPTPVMKEQHDPRIDALRALLARGSK